MKKRQRELRAAPAVDTGVQALFMHGVTLHQQGLVDAARTAYQQVLAMQPRHFDAHHLLGVLAYQKGDLVESARSIRAALEIDPGHAGALSNLGLTLLNLQRVDEALASFERAVMLQPQFAAGHFNCGDAFLAGERFDQAVASYERALALDPALTRVYSKRGYALQMAGRHAQALEDFERALRLDPTDAEVLSNRGVALQELGRLDEAFASCREAIALNPMLPGVHYAMGTALMTSLRLPEAVASFDRAIDLKPGYAQAQWNKALALLLQGRLAEGWPLYEWRWENGISGSRRLAVAQPLWLGDEALSGKTVLIYCEQGLGDTLQFCRYAQAVKAAGATVILEVQAPLVGLLADLPGVDHLIEQGKARPAFDLHCPLLSLPLAFETELGTIPSPGPYLVSSPDRRRRWAERLGEASRPRVGLVWSGSTTHARDRERSIALKDLLAALPEGPEYVSLQKDVRPGDLETLERSGVRHFGDQLQDFSDTAALCDQMDLVVTVDTSVAHLAAALGKPTWIMLACNPDFRWLLDRSDSPWYDAVTLYRQAVRGNWSAVLEKVAVDLRALHANQSPA